MGEKDKIEKLLEDYPDVFADIINVLVYQGEELFLNFSLKGTTESYDERINLTTVNNVNGVPIHTM